MEKHNQKHDTKAQKSNTKAQQYDTKSVSFRNFWSSTKNRSSPEKKGLIGTPGISGTKVVCLYTANWGINYMLPTKPTFYGKQKQPLTFAIVSGFDDMSPHLEGFPTTITLKPPKKKKMKVLNLRGLRAGFYVANPPVFSG